MVELEWQDEVVASVEPVDGAADVRFPWGLAQAALADIEAMWTQLGGEVTVRATMLDGPNGETGLGAWAGPFRTEFDAQDDHYSDQIEDQRTSLLTVGNAIFDEARQAARVQGLLNASADTTSQTAA